MTEPLNEPLAARIAAGMTQPELSFKARVSMSTIVRCEREGQWPHNPSVRKQYMRALKVKPQQPAKGAP